MTYLDSSTESLSNKCQSARYITERLRGSNPVPGTKFRVKWAEELRCLTGVYVRRWYIETAWFSIRLHHWLHSDDARAHHDHPWDFITIILRGGYSDVTAEGVQKMHPGKIAFRRAEHSHTVQVNPEGCWSFLLTGPQKRRWGFWVGRKWKKSNKYFLEHGMHVCSGGEATK